MSLYSASEQRFLAAISKLGYCNPFLPERVEHERASLGSHFVSGEAVWSASVADPDATSPNVVRIHGRLEPLMENMPARIAAASEITPEEFTLYEECIHHLLYQRYYLQFVASNRRHRSYRQFLADWNRYFHISGKRLETAVKPAHLFSCFRQIQRAFHHIFDNIIGNSMPAARLRASVWQSVFTPTCGATTAHYTCAWAISQRSSPGLRDREKSWWRGRSLGRDTFPSIRTGWSFPSFRRVVLSHQPGGVVADTDRIGTVWSSQGRIHRSDRRPAGMAGRVSGARVGVPGRTGGDGSFDSGEAAAGD